MEEPKEKRDFTPLTLILAAGLFALIPNAVYLVQSRFRMIPSQKEWDKIGGNHGPWHGEWEEQLLMLCGFLILILILVTILRPIWLTISRKVFDFELTCKHVVFVFAEFLILCLLIQPHFFWLTD